MSSPWEELLASVEELERRRLHQATVHNVVRSLKAYARTLGQELAVIWNDASNGGWLVGDKRCMTGAVVQPQDADGVTPSNGPVFLDVEESSITMSFLEDGLELATLPVTADNGTLWTALNNE